MIEIGHGISIAPLKIELLSVRVRTESDIMTGGRSYYVFNFQVLDRDTGKPIYTQVTKEVDERYPGIPLCQIISQTLEEVMCHEVAEVLRLNGKRFRDPHQ